MDREEPEVVESIDRIVGAAREEGLAAGIFTGSTEYAGRMIEAGFNFVNVSSDAGIMASAASDVAAALRERLSAP
jgi:4-hydroxy-2-oxoheptanedioate aldolase